MSHRSKARSTRTCTLALLAVSILAPTSLAGVTPFSEEAVLRGISYQTISGYAQHGYGLGLIDLDNDGDADAITTGGPLGLVGFWENDGNGYFTDRNNGTILPYCPDASSVAAADFDGDHDLDLFITNFLSSDLLLRNDGNFQFTDVSRTAGVDHIGPSYAVSWGDVNGDGWLDLYVGKRTGAFGSFEDNLMYINNGDGTFTEVGETWGVHSGHFPTLVQSFFDYDRDGDADLYVGNDKGTGASFQNFMFRNENNTHFVDVTEFTGTRADVDCMGIAVGDVFHTGLQDIYVTNTPPGHIFFTQNADHTFTDSTLDANVGAYEIGWAAAFIDIDNDTWHELYVAHMAAQDFLYEFNGMMPAVEMGAAYGLNHPSTSFCTAIGDVDNDGDLDIMTQSPDELVRLYINKEGDKRNWVKFDVVGTFPNWYSIGAQVDLRIGSSVQMREMRSGHNYKSQDHTEMHFGLGSATVIDELVINWPRGATRTITNVPGNQKWPLYQTGRLGDVDADGAIDATDVAGVDACLTGPSVPTTPGCAIYDFSSESELDLRDIAALQEAYTG